MCARQRSTKSSSLIFMGRKQRKLTDPGQIVQLMRVDVKIMEMHICCHQAHYRLTTLKSWASSTTLANTLVAHHFSGRPSSGFRWIARLFPQFLWRSNREAVQLMLQVWENLLLMWQFRALIRQTPTATCRRRSSTQAVFLACASTTLQRARSKIDAERKLLI